MTKSHPFTARRRALICITCTLVFLGFAAISANAETRVLGDAAWRADITTVAQTIRDVHPRPFRVTSEDEFVQTYEELISDVPQLSDKEIVIRLVALVALIDDGHTRLSIPRQHPEIGLEFGHTPTPQPSHTALEFKQLPLAFEQFDDGVFVVATSTELADLIGFEVTGIDGTPISDALESLQAITFAENSQLEKLMGVDRLTLIEALEVLGISKSAETVTLELIANDGVSKKVSVNALPPGPISWVGPFAGKPTPIRFKNSDEVFWSEYVSDGNFVYMQLDQIADEDISLAEFVVTTLKNVIKRDAKLIIDIRNNFGGSGGLNKSLVMSIIQNEALNQYDRTFVLTGRRTFSAAQMLVNELEQYTRVSFVGEPTGSRPDHYGDPKKVRLEYSGLTLRVSRLHWSSYTAFDEREASIPDFSVNWTSADYFSGGDPALALAVSLKDISLKSLLRTPLREGDLHKIGRYTLDSKLSPQTYGTDFSSQLLELGDEFAEEGDVDAASFAYQVGLYFYPKHKNLKAAFERLEAVAVFASE